MAQHTEIQWADTTANPVMGCDGCELLVAGRRGCYAAHLHATRGKGSKGYAANFDQVELFPGRMAAAARYRDLCGRRRPGRPWLDGRRRLIFVSDMGDALSRAVSFEYLREQVIDVVTSMLGLQHDWLWLSKRSRRMAEFSAWLQHAGITWPPNLWAGTSVSARNNAGRVKQLLSVGDASTARFLSLEPQWGPVDLGAELGSLDVVIQGGQSGPRSRPFDLAWARSMRDACASAGVAYFLKQLGARPEEHGQQLRLEDRHGGDWSEWPVDLRVRELPSQAAK